MHSLALRDLLGKQLLLSHLRAAGSIRGSSFGAGAAGASNAWPSRRIFNHASTHSLDPQLPLFVAPVQNFGQAGNSTLEQLDRSTQEDLLALLTQMIGHHVPTSCASDERGVPDESH